MCVGSSGTSVVMESWAANAEGAGFETGDGIAAAVTVTVANVPGMSSPGTGLADTVYCEAPGPVGPLIAQVMSAVPSFRTTKDCGTGAALPQVARNGSDDGVIVGPPPSPLPETKMGEGSGPQMAPVAAIIAMLPVTPLTARGVNVADSAWVPLGGIVNVRGATLNGEGPPALEDASPASDDGVPADEASPASNEASLAPEEASASSGEASPASDEGVPPSAGTPPVDATSVMVAGALPAFFTLKDWVADSSSWMAPKLPKFGVAVALVVSKVRIAPLGSSVRAITCGDVSASVSTVKVALIGVVGELAGTAGPVTVTFSSPPPAAIVSPVSTLVVNPGAPVSDAVVT
jgi:hypothetical protein